MPFLALKRVLYFLLRPMSDLSVRSEGGACRLSDVDSSLQRIPNEERTFGTKSSKRTTAELLADCFSSDMNER